MKLRNIVSQAALLALFVTGLWAASIDGKWTAEVPGRDGQTRTQTFNLKADGDKLTGNVSSPMGEREISDGKISGDDVSFKVKVEFNGNAMTMNYTGKIAGDELKLKMDNGRRQSEFVAKRAQ